MLEPKRLVLTDSFLDQYKDKQPDWGYSGLGYVTFKRTYAELLDDGTLEEWWQMVRRVVEGCYYEQIKHCFKNKLPFNYNKGQISAQRMYDLIWNMKFLPPGRGLEHMGRKSVDVKGGAILNNCAFYSTENIDKDFSRPFTFLMDFSALGVGVGFDVRGAGKVRIKGPSDAVAPFVVPDDREGWVESLRLLLEAFAYHRPMPIFDYSLVRPEGRKLNTLGGTASGPIPLMEMHWSIGKILFNRIGSTITSSDIVDIMNLVGKCIVSGASRRSAELALGFPGDLEFLDLKNPELHQEELKSHRWSSNNSVFATVGMDYAPLAERTVRNGEPGYFWLNNARTYGRMKDGPGQHDEYVLGGNPCLEQPLESAEVCNLAEAFVARHDSLEELQATIKYAYLYAKSVTLVPTHDGEVNAIIGRNRRIGLSVTGIAQAINKFGYRNLMMSLDTNYKYVRELDKMYSRWLCIPTSIKCTTVKPSGSISLLPGSTPGVHFPHSEYYIRNLRIQAKSPIIKRLRKAGYKCEPSVYGDNTVVVSFPVHEENFFKSKRDVGMFEQLELAAQLQHYWSDNAVSVTVTFSEAEAGKIADALSMYETRLKSVSFLPLDNHGYEQAPYIEITKEEYEKMAKKLKPLDLSGKIEHEESESGCTTDSCEIREFRQQAENKPAKEEEGQ